MIGRRPILKQMSDRARSAQSIYMVMESLPPGDEKARASAAAGEHLVWLMQQIDGNRCGRATTSAARLRPVRMREAARTQLPFAGTWLHKQSAEAGWNGHCGQERRLRLCRGEKSECGGWRLRNPACGGTPCSTRQREGGGQGGIRGIHPHADPFVAPKEAGKGRIAAAPAGPISEAGSVPRGEMRPPAKARGAHAKMDLLHAPDECIAGRQ